MAVAFDTVQSVVGTVVATGTANTTPSLTVSGSATLAIATVEMSLDVASDALITVPATITLGGSGSFTRLASAIKHSGGDAQTAGFVDLYYLLSPPTGSNTATWSPAFTGGGSKGCWTLTVSTWTGTSASAPTFASSTNGTADSAETVTGTLAAGGAIVGIACNGSSNPGVTTGTSLAVPTGTANTGSHFTRSAYNLSAGGGSTSIVFSTNSADLSASTALIIAPSGGGGSRPLAPAVIVPQARRRASYY